jgi:D-arabinose 1-dehydrogenase-like Zn-dependent alcohol dehydrogenase
MLKLGAHYFALTSDPEVMKSLAGEFDVILNTVSADHDYNEYLKLLNTNGTMIVVGMPSGCNSCSLISFETQKYYGKFDWWNCRNTRDVRLLLSIISSQMWK